jgi:hypothetical protein
VDHKLSVTVQVALDGQKVRISAGGCLTRLSQSGLHPLIRRARGLAPGVQVTVDLTGTRHVEAIGVELLRWAVDHDVPDHHGPAVEIVVPEPLPDHLIPAAPPVPDASGGTGRPPGRPRTAPAER